MTTLRSVRRANYKVARRLGDVNAVLSGQPGKVAKRVVNRWTGRNIARRLFLR